MKTSRPVREISSETTWRSGIGGAALIALFAIIIGIHAEVAEAAPAWNPADREIAPPTGAPEFPFAKLEAVSCGAPGYCSAVGGYSEPGEHQVMVVDRVAGVWQQAQEVSVPSGHEYPLLNPATSLTASLKATCAAAGTATPKILADGTWLNHPGDRKTQTFTAEADYKPLPAECEGVFRRIPAIKFQVQSPTSHSHWSDASGYLTPKKSQNVQKEELEQLEEEREEEGKSCWVSTSGGKRNTCRTSPLITKSGGIGDVYFHPAWKLHEPSYSRHDPRLYRCTPGDGITHARALFKGTITSVSTGKLVEQRVVAIPVRVRHYPGKGPMPKAWRGAVRGPC